MPWDFAPSKADDGKGTWLLQEACCPSAAARDTAAHERAHGHQAELTAPQNSNHAVLRPCLRSLTAVSSSLLSWWGRLATASLSSCPHRSVAFSLERFRTERNVPSSSGEQGATPAMKAVSRKVAPA